MRYKIQQLSLGGILDQAISVTKNHFGKFFLITLGVFGLNAAVLLITAQLPKQQIGPIEVPIADESTQMLLRVLNLLSIIVGPITNAAIVHGIAQAYLGKSLSVGDSLRRAFGAFIPLFWTWLLVGLAIAGGFLLLIVPGILCAFWFTLATQVVVIEKVSGIAAMKRSKALMKGNIGTLFAMCFVIGALMWALLIGAFFIGQPQVQAIVMAVVQSLVMIIGSAATVVFYFSCRCKHENFDLQLLAESVGSDDSADDEMDDGEQA